MSKAIARRAFLGLVPIIMVVLGYGEVFMSQARAAEGVKNVLLIHGGFVDGSGWQGVYDLLKKDGYNVAIVQNPTTSLADDVAVTKRTLAAWLRLPRWYLVSTEDRMIPPDAQRGMSKRAGSTVTEVKGSHSVYVSQPQAVAAIITEAAHGVALAT